MAGAVSDDRLMRLGIALPHSDLSGAPLGPGSWIEAAQTAERLGYSSIWSFDAIGRGFILPDPLMALAAVASHTTVELATGIMQLPIRNVAEVAHRIFTLEVLAPGRILFGVGPGSTEADFKVFGGNYATRFADFDKQWEELQTWVSDGSLGDRDLGPWPSVLGGPALLLAGWRGPWVERAAAESEGWIASAHYCTDGQLAEAIGRYRDAGGERAIVTNVQVGEDLAPTIGRLSHLAAIGFDDAVILDRWASEERLSAIIDGMDSPA